ncbi:MAG: hypothetical protein GQE15_34920 [Archangiaceae bacterium]|nr:hypothetical protein [Archangiaceae bacterium]
MTPLFATPPTLEHARGLVKVWLFDERATMVDQVLSPSLSDEVASFLTTEVEAQLQTRYVSKGRKVTYVHDWSACTGYESKARDRLIEWGRASLAHSAHVTVCISDQASPFVRIAAVTGVGVLRMLKMPIELVSDLAPALAPLR